MIKFGGASAGVIGTVAGIIVTIFLAQTLLSPLISKMEWFGDSGVLGIFLFLLLHIILAIILAPASLSKFVSGVIFGFWGGWIIALIGGWLGAILPFWISRKALHNWVSNKLEQMPMTTALNQGVSKNGFKCVFLTRVSLVLPYSGLNYGYGLTNVTWRDYLRGNWGMIVPAGLYAWWGSQAKELSESVIEGGKDWTYWVAIISSIILTIGIIWYLRKITLDNIPIEMMDSTGMVQEP